MEEQTAKRKAEWFDIDEERNRYVYVSGLPNTLTEDEYIDLMKKYGIIAKKGNAFNIKMYKDDAGTFKGDGLCCFARTESVDLAITHLDGYIFDSTHTLKCERAKFQMKGDYDATKKPRPLDKKAKYVQKKNIEKLLSWEAKGEVLQKKVILKNMFKPEEITDDPELLLDLKQDVESKCEEIKCEPKRIDIYENHPEGVISVTFNDHVQAEKCIKALDNEFYGGRVVDAKLWDGKTKYKKTKE